MKPPAPLRRDFIHCPLSSSLTALPDRLVTLQSRPAGGAALRERLAPIVARRQYAVCNGCSPCRLTHNLGFWTHKMGSSFRLPVFVVVGLGRLLNCDCEAVRTLI